MSPRHLIGILLAGLLAGCPHEGPHGPEAEPLTEPGVTFPVAGTLKGPRGFLSTSEVTRQLRPFAEDPLPGVRVFLADAKMQPLPEAPVATTGADGSFTLASPHRAGFLMARTASASAPLMAFYRSGHPAAVSVSSTMVAWKVATDMATRSVAITALDPAKIQAASELVHKELVNQALKPDFSLASWPDALDFHTYKVQGELAKAFNAIIPGSVAGRMSR